MTTREYVNHLVRINEQEIVHLPPFRGSEQAFPEEELKGIIMYGLPNSWKKEMNKFDFDLYRNSVMQLVDFCERLESSESRDGPAKQDNKKGTSSPGRKSKYQHDKSSSKNQKEGGKWCVLHETDTHNTKDCHAIKKLKASRKPEGGAKTWKARAEKEKEKAKKELNTIKKKMAKLRKGLDDSTKSKRKSDDSDDEIHALEQEMEDVDKQLAMFDANT